MKIYSSVEATEKLSRLLPHWQLDDNQLKRTFKSSGWKSSLMLVNAIGHLAEKAWHHPTITVTWGRVEVLLCTHEPPGITDQDFELALLIEQFVTWQPDEQAALTGTPDQPAWRYLLAD